MVKKYLQFIKEAIGDGKVDSSKYAEIKGEIKSMIEKTIEINKKIQKNKKVDNLIKQKANPKNSGGEFASFVNKFAKEPDEVKIEGLINDSDLYDFYLKFRNDIDEMLNDLKFFGSAPSEVNALGLYDYLIKGTQKAIEETVKLLSEEKPAEEPTEDSAKEE